MEKMVFLKILASVMLALVLAGVAALIRSATAVDKEEARFTSSNRCSLWCLALATACAMTILAVTATPTAEELSKYPQIFLR